MPYTHKLLCFGVMISTNCSTRKQRVNIFGKKIRIRPRRVEFAQRATYKNSHALSRELQELTMADDPTLRRPADSSRINLSQGHEVRWWTKALGCTREQLEQAVKAVCISLTKVRAHLKG
jgi:hypothetical protein